MAKEKARKNVQVDNPMFEPEPDAEDQEHDFEGEEEGEVEEEEENTPPEPEPEPEPEYQCRSTRSLAVPVVPVMHATFCRVHAFITDYN